MQGISTSLASVDRMLGGRGLPRGRIVELAGPPGACKTTLALKWAAAAQAQGAIAAFVDTEHALDAAWAKSCGVVLEEMVVLKPGSGNDAVRMAESLLGTFSVDLLILDSIAALVPDEELEAAPVDRDVHTEALYGYFRKLANVAERCRTALLFVNQARPAPSNPYRTAGERALAMHAAIRLFVEPISDCGGEQQSIRLTSRKNKLADSFVSLELDRNGCEIIERVKKSPGTARAKEARAWSGGR